MNRENVPTEHFLVDPREHRSDKFALSSGETSAIRRFDSGLTTCEPEIRIVEDRLTEENLGTIRLLSVRGRRRDREKGKKDVRGQDVSREDG